MTELLPPSPFTVDTTGPVGSPRSRLPSRTAVQLFTEGDRDTEMEKDAGILTLDDGTLLFRFLSTDDHIRVAETAQLPDHRDPALKSILGQPVAILWTKVREADGSPRLMAHRLALHRDIRLRAFEISQSAAASVMPVENWLRAEDELVGTT